MQIFGNLFRLDVRIYTKEALQNCSPAFSDLADENLAKVSFRFQSLFLCDDCDPTPAFIKQGKNYQFHNCFKLI